MCFYQQIGCSMGFSITGCVFSGVMFICYCITLASYSELIKCNRYSRGYLSSYRNSYYNCYRKYHFYRARTENVPALGSCLLILSLAELFLTLASSIYCYKTECCNSPAAGNTVSNYHQQFGC